MSSYGETRNTIARPMIICVLVIVVGIVVAYHYQLIPQDLADIKNTFWLVFLATLGITGIVLWILDYYYEKAFETSTPEGDLAAIKLSRSRFMEAVTCAKAIGADYPAVWSKEVLDEFQAIENEISEKPEKSAEARSALVQRACDLAALRAFVAVPPGLEIQGNGAISEMMEWAVPSTTIQRLSEHAVNLRSNNLAVSRMTLWTLYKEEDVWSDYVDWYYHFMSRLGAGLLICTLGVLVTALVAFRHNQVLAALIFGGMSGALLSVLMRLPTVVGHGDFWSYLYRILIRVGTGTTASVMGLGFFTSGLINLSTGGTKTPKTIAELILECGDPSPAIPECPISSSLILLALAMLLGFTERALTFFEDKVFPPAPSPTPTVQNTPEHIVGVKVVGPHPDQHPTSVRLDDRSSVPLTARAVYANKTEVDVTQTASWSSKDTSVVKVSNAGACQPVNVGETDVEATYSGRTGIMTVRVYKEGSDETTRSKEQGSQDAPDAHMIHGQGITEPDSSETPDTKEKEMPTPEYESTEIEKRESQGKQENDMGKTSEPVVSGAQETKS